MNPLLSLAIEAHGGLERWKRIKLLRAKTAFSGQLMEAKGFAHHLYTTATVDTLRPLTILDPYPLPGSKGVFTPDKVWVESGETITATRDAPRDAFKGHTRETKWDELHRLYFVGYALWNYLTTPFLLAGEGFELEELAPHAEDGETWRVLRAAFPAWAPTHCPVQLFYFASNGMLKRIDYQTDVAGGVASHYPYDPKTFHGIVVPTRRRVVQRKDNVPKLTGITGIFLEFTDVDVVE